MIRTGEQSHFKSDTPKSQAAHEIEFDGFSRKEPMVDGSQLNDGLKSARKSPRASQQQTTGPELDQVSANAGRTFVKELLVVGAGPAGLALTKYLRERGLNVRIVDRFGHAGGAFARMSANITLSSPAAFLGLPGLSFESQTRSVTAAEYRRYLEAYAVRWGLSIEKREVVKLVRNGAEYLVQFRDESFYRVFEAVVAATGMSDNPVLPNLIGINDSVVKFHSQDWPGPEGFVGRRILIIGSGMRAVEIAEECANFGLNPIVSAKSGVVKLLRRTLLGVDLRYFIFPVLRRLPIRVFGAQCMKGWSFRAIDRGFRRHVTDGKITIKPAVVRIDGQDVSFQDNSFAQVDVVVCATGYRFDMPFLPKTIRRTDRGYPFLAHGECIDSPGLFLLGVPCAVRADSQFIHGIAADAPIVAKRISEYVGQLGVVRKLGGVSIKNI